MSFSWRRQRLPEICAELARRPGHENTRVLFSELLSNGLGVASVEIEHERRLEAVGGRADMLFGATVFEFKRDLQRELPNVHARLPGYLAERGRQAGRRFLGIATDGAELIGFELDAAAGALRELGRHRTRADGGDALLAWLETAVSDRDKLSPEPLMVARLLGRDSLTLGRAMATLAELWAGLATHPEVALKRQLWDGLLREAYGASVGDDALFLQHTYLTVVAKTMAARALGIGTAVAADILSGAALRADGIHGAVESDFFDWVLLAGQPGADIVGAIARQVSRFELGRVEVDVLKTLYESLIDRRARHGLGEYYTPDWLAARLAGRAINRPLDERVLDPACGSGTFLFHAVRRLRAAAAAAGWAPSRTLRACTDQVRGIDIHPVAVIIARVTWLLALGDLVRQRSGDLHVPVYLGDALQWARRVTGQTTDFIVAVPNERALHVPAGLAQSQAAFDAGVEVLAAALPQGATAATVETRLRGIDGVLAADAAAMAATYTQLQGLYAAGRNGIWPFVLRNLARPLWLSRPDQRAHVVIGNPPWVAYRHLSAELKPRVRDASKRMNLWVGGALATQQDLCALFWGRCAERYLRTGGTIAFVLPRAALNRPAFAGLRAGDLRDVTVRVREGWSLDNQDVSPLFPVPACVLIGERDAAGPPPARVWRATGDLPARDATAAQAAGVLRWTEEGWPAGPTLLAASPYRARFAQGATIVPRRFFIVDREAATRLGMNRAAPRVRGRAGPLDKHPWTEVEPPRGPVETDFLRPVLLGAGIGPFRLLPPEVTGVVPLARDGALLDAGMAAARGHRHLAAWLGDIEAKWTARAERGVGGALRMTLSQRLNHQSGLTRQPPAPSLRVAYGKAGTVLTAAVLADPKAVVDHTAYWTAARSLGEAHYLMAVLNSETVRARIAHLQARGEGGARHFDNLAWELPIPQHDAALPLHRALADAATRAEALAATVPLNGIADFKRQRRVIRDALTATGLRAEMDALVAHLLDGS